MRYILISTIFCLFFVTLAHSQDTLFRSNGIIMPVILIKVDTANISYKKIGDTTSLIYSINKSYVSKIVYQNGQVENFTQSTNSGSAQTKNALSYTADTCPNSLSLNIFNLIWGLITIDYERTFSSGNFSIKIPLTIGIHTNQPSDAYDYPDNTYKDRLFRTGCGIYFYPGNSNTTRYFIGSSFEFGKNRDINSFDGKYENIWIYSLLLQNGFTYKPSGKLFISLFAGVGFGFQHFTYTNSYSQFQNNEMIFAYNAGINIGFRF